MLISFIGNINEKVLRKLRFSQWENDFPGLGFFYLA